MDRTTTNLVSALIPYTCPFHVLSCSVSFADFPIRKAPKNGADIPSSVPKLQGSGMCLAERAHKPHGLCSGSCYSADVSEFNVNECV